MSFSVNSSKRNKKKIRDLNHIDTSPQPRGMNVMDANDLSGAYLPPEVADEAVLAEECIDVESVDPSSVVFVGDIGDIIVPEEVYQEWPEEAVALEEIPEEEQIELEAFVNEGGIIYEEQPYEYVLSLSGFIELGLYAQDEVIPVEEVDQLDAQLPLEAVPARYVDEDGIEYTEDELVPVETPIVDYEEEGLDPLSSRGRRKPPTIVQCEVCGVVVKHPSKIEAHMRTHTGEKPYSCEICGAKFTQRTPMVNHVRRHLGQTPFVCGYGCGKSFVNNAQKNAHELRHMGTKRSGPPRPHLKPPKRHVWSKYFSKSRQNEGEKAAMVDFAPPVGQIEPPISAAASKRLDEVIESVVTGIPIKKRRTRAVRAPMLVQCQICGLMLKHASKIRAHIRTHTGDRPYSCAYCDAQFSTSGTLNMHVKRKHTSGERPYACTWDCGKRFVSLSTRNEHERVVHAGTRRYECTVPGCYRMFSRRSYLMLHRQREHEQMFKPIFDPKEIEKAEKEADMELMAENQEGTTNELGSSNQILVDPTTNMLVHVSEDGMVLEPLAEQTAFIQGEFVEDTEEVEIAEFDEEEASDSKLPRLYVPVENSKPIEYMPSDIELDPGPSNIMDVPLLEEEPSKVRKVTEEHDMPVLFEESKAPSAKNENDLVIGTGPVSKPRMVNILKRKLPLRLPIRTMPRQ
ncbi:zinc finger, C2H2 type [Ancylostoma ceylanicum]|uniref:Zinc finger, C2H2 type n=1 Tax=Ancylostoma ceylanicum TaxID=53326 RepID=A0A0D6M3T7_9BILA|nr:zinc finger, C2H2 type [Ancylostoma ceylanicum]